MLESECDTNGESTPELAVASPIPPVSGACFAPPPIATASPEPPLPHATRQHSHAAASPGTPPPTPVSETTCKTQAAYDSAATATNLGMWCYLELIFNF